MEFLDKLRMYMEDSDSKFQKQLEVRKKEVSELLKKGYEPEHQCSVKDCIRIAKLIQEENKNKGNHMIEKTPEELYKGTQKNGCIKFTKDGKLVGFITLMPLEIRIPDGSSIKMYERGSLVVEKMHRKKGLGRALIAEMLINHQRKPMYSVTNVAAVQKINEKLSLKKYTQKELPKFIKKPINSIQPLLKNDIIYGNKMFEIIIDENKKHFL